MSSSGARDGGWDSAPALVAIGASILVAIILLVLTGISGTWLVLVCLALAALAVVSLSGHPVRALLSGYVLTAPVAVSKAVATGAGVYAPALEITLSDLFLIAVIVFWLAERIMGGKRSTGRSPAFIGLPVVVFFFAWAWVSALHSGVLSHGLLAALNLSKYFVVFLVVSQLVKSGDDMRWLLGAAAAGLMLQVGMAGLQFLTGSSLVFQGIKTSSSAMMGYNLSYTGGMEAFRPSGLLQHPVFFASYLVMLLPTPLALLLLGPKRLGVRVWGACIVLAAAGTAALVLTLSRGGWIAFAIAVIFLFVAGVRLKLVTRFQFVIANGLAILAAVTILAAYPPVIQRLTGSDERSGESRLLMMEQAWGIVKHSPVFGVGMASYVAAARKDEPPSYAFLDPQFRKTLSSGVVHNAYLAIWAERGVVGLLSLLSVFAWYMRAFFRLKHWRDPVWHALGLGIVAGLVGQLAMYMFDHGYLDSRPGMIWLVFALLAATLRLQRPDDEPNEMAVAP